MRQFVALFFCGVLSAACGTMGASDNEGVNRKIGKGGVVSDEPVSAVIGKRILSSGGNAVDTMVAMYFAQSVAYPSSGTLGGGGICVVHKGADGTSAAIDFRPGQYQVNGKVVAIPGAVRGLFSLHARFGRINWEKLLLPAERLARFGHPLTRAFSRRLAEIPRNAVLDHAVHQTFYDNGTPLTEGQQFIQLPLSRVLAQIRIQGAGAFYNGDLAKELAVGLGKATNIVVPVSALNSYRPIWSTPETISFRNQNLHFPGGRIGTKSVALWRAALDGQQPNVSYGSPLDSAGMSVVDINGDAVACIASSNGILGAQKMIGLTGILMANQNADFFPGLPIIIADKNFTDVTGTITAAGGSNAQTMAINTAMRAFFVKSPLNKIYQLERVKTNILTNIIRCVEGSRRRPSSCNYVVDPVGYGLAIGTSF